MPGWRACDPPNIGRGRKQLTCVLLLLMKVVLAKLMLNILRLSLARWCFLFTSGRSLVPSLPSRASQTRATILNCATESRSHARRPPSPPVARELPSLHGKVAHNFPGHSRGAPFSGLALPLHNRAGDPWRIMGTGWPGRPSRPTVSNRQTRCKTMVYANAEPRKPGMRRNVSKLRTPPACLLLPALSLRREPQPKGCASTARGDRRGGNDECRTPPIHAIDGDIVVSVWGAVSTYHTCCPMLVAARSDHRP